MRRKYVKERHRQKSDIFLHGIRHTLVGSSAVPMLASLFRQCTKPSRQNNGPRSSTPLIHHSRVAPVLLCSASWLTVILPPRTHLIPLDLPLQFFFLSAPPSTVISWPWCGVSLVQWTQPTAPNHTCHEARIDEIQCCICDVLGPACTIGRVVVNVLFADLAFPVCAILVTCSPLATSSHTLHHE
jgi:hypothetical protein